MSERLSSCRNERGIHVSEVYERSAVLDVEGSSKHEEKIPRKCKSACLFAVTLLRFARDRGLISSTQREMVNMIEK